MGFFRRTRNEAINSSHSEENKINWKNLGGVHQLNEIEQQSHKMPVAIFKHSTRCGVSRGVLKSFESDFSLSDDDINLYFLDLLAHRDISNEIASKFKVHHESPQLIVIKEGKVVYAESHNSIDASDLNQFV